MIREDEVYKIGRVGKPHGVRGELTVHISDDVFDRVEAEYLVLCTDGILVPFFMEEYRFKNDEQVLVKFCDIDTKQQAQRLTGCEVYFDRRLAENVADEHPSLHQLVGYTLIDTAAGGKTVGTITAIDDSTANVLFCIETQGGAEVLVPVAACTDGNIDNYQRTVSATLPEGLADC